MKSRLLLLVSIVCLGVVVLPTPAQAASKHWAFQASAGGSYIQLADGTVTSDLTAPSTVSGGPGAGPKSDKASVAAAHAANAVKLGAVRTRTRSNTNGSTQTLHSVARTAGVNLLNGLVRIDAVTSTLDSSAAPNGATTYSGNTEFAGLHIAGVHVPVNIRKNMVLTIPGVATVALNYTRHASTSDAKATMGWALSLTLLQGRDGLAKGAMIVVNPMTQFFNEATPMPGAPVLGGMAFGTMASANAGSLAGVESSPTAFIGTPYNGSKGKTVTRTTASVSVPGLLGTGVVTTTDNSTASTDGSGRIRNTSTVAGLNILGGLVKATALKVVANGQLVGNQWTGSTTMTTAKLVVAGKALPLNVKPNTTINVAGLGRVQLNYQAKNPLAHTNEVDAVRITLSTAKAGLKAGAVIEVAVAATQIAR